VTLAEGPHPFPFRTRQLSPPAPMVLRGRLRGRVGRRRGLFLRSPGLVPGLSCFSPRSESHSPRTFARRITVRRESGRIRRREVLPTQLFVSLTQSTDRWLALAIDGTRFAKHARNVASAVRVGAIPLLLALLSMNSRFLTAPAARDCCPMGTDASCCSSSAGAPSHCGTLQSCSRDSDYVRVHSFDPAVLPSPALPIADSAGARCLEAPGIRGSDVAAPLVPPPRA
jgi:hypothetical protein